MREAAIGILQRHQMLRLPDEELSWSILWKHKTLFTMGAAAKVIRQRHQMLRLPRKRENLSWSILWKHKTLGGRVSLFIGHFCQILETIC